jgi:HAMP domain-containing protein
MKIKNKLLFLILILAIIPAIAISFVFYTIGVETLREQIKVTHYEAVSAVDTIIFVVVSDMVNIAFTAAPKIADLIEKQDYYSLKKKLNTIDQMNVEGVGTGRGLGYHIAIVTDKEGYILARSDTRVVGKKIIELEVAQKGHILYLDEEKQDNWNYPENFRIAWDKARTGYSDARKIIYNQEFLKREDYDHLIDEYGFKEMMGLTAFQPIFGQKDEDPEKEQIGILILITILNNNHAAISAINAITGAEFTAITPAGEIMASFFVNPPIPSPEIVTKAKERAGEIAQRTREPTGKDTVFYTKERIYLKSCPEIVVFKGENIGSCYVNGEIIPIEKLQEKAYRLHFISEVDPDDKHVSIRGIAYDLTDFDALIASQTKHSTIVFLIAFLFIGGLGLIATKKIASPIVQFTQEIQQIEKEKGFGKKIDIKTGDEIETLSIAFNSMGERLSQSYEEIKEQKDILEIKVQAKTRELRELTNNLDEQVKEKTKNLQERINELEKFHTLTIGRELKMIELKQEIAELKEKLQKLQPQK